MPDSTDGSANLDNSHVNGVVVGVNLGTIIYGRPPDELERERLIKYLRQLSNSHNTMRVVGLGSSHLKSGIDLASAYMMLAVQHRYQVVRALTDEEVAAYQQQQFELPEELSATHCLPDQAILAVDDRAGPLALLRAELATETVLAQPYLVLCGAPGSGKSTFAKHLVWALAQRGLDQLTQQTSLLGWNDQRRLLPVFMPLRLLAGALAGKDLGLTDIPNIGLLFDAIYIQLHDQYGLEEPRELLSAGLARSHKVLFVFDGLDEVPLEANDQSIDRTSLLTFLRLFANCHNARMLITCRSRAWTQEYSIITQWPMAELAPLSGGQIARLINNWFPLLHAKGMIDQAAIEHYCGQLLQALHDLQRRRLREMAENPLLLSMMIFVLAKKGVLPRDRHSLYEEILRQLLGEWDVSSRKGQDLAQTIGDERITSKKLRDFVLDRLCYQAHLNTISTDGRGRIDALTLKNALMAYFAKIKIKTNDPYWAAERCVAYIDQRSGLIHPEDAGDVYVFAHLTLQEHSAGRHLLFEEPLQQILALRRDDRWREPIFLGIGCLADDKRSASKIGELLAALINSYEFRSKPRQSKHRYDWYRDLVLAAAIGAECDWDMLNGADLDVEHFQCELQASLSTMLNDQAHAQVALDFYHGQAMQPAPLLIQERQKAAELLASLGDPRYPVSIAQWQQATRQLSQQFGREGNHYWRYVPAGRYQVGGWDEPEQAITVELQPYWVGRLMVTVEQYRAFIDAGGYSNDAWWTERGLKWKTSEERTQSSFWDQQLQREHLNQPIYGVSWYEAMAYCHWLTEQLEPLLPTGYAICLASEAEWEVAAAYNNQSQRQTYPWGKQPATPEHAVYDWSTENRSVSVGLGLVGQTACGSLDSVGNLWEWTATLYQQENTEVQQAVNDSDGWMVLRGGAYYDDTTNVRCAARFRNLPYFGDLNHGFRCVVALRVS